MNILPKKRWHVRTKENKARVRKDEAEAAEKERQEQLRIDKANQEARLSILKQKSKQKLQEFGAPEPEPKSAPTEHINLFNDYENAVQTTNKEHENDLKNKKEEYEKKIGYLTYLGQDTNEALGKKNWYEVAPESRYSKGNEIKDTYDKLVLKDEDGKPKLKDIDIKDGVIGWKRKQELDPINIFKKYLHSDKKVSKTTENNRQVTSSSSKHQNKKISRDDKDEKSVKLQKLREARLKREQQEKYRTELFLKGLNKPTPSQERDESPKIKAKYNSQFNPELARQNFR